MEIKAGVNVDEETKKEGLTMSEDKEIKQEELIEKGIDHDAPKEETWSEKIEKEERSTAVLHTIIMIVVPPIITYFVVNFVWGFNTMTSDMIFWTIIHTVLTYGVTMTLLYLAIRYWRMYHYEDEGRF